ncbi:hypothetical protein BGX27_009492 [Mortierella sp. AM989]|nr:hypothetical protein BGX27_009492 [Mortierella sp. AM989]
MSTTPQKSATEGDEVMEQTQDAAASKRRRLSSPFVIEIPSPISKRRRTSERIIPEEDSQPTASQFTPDEAEATQAPHSDSNSSTDSSDESDDDEQQQQEGQVEQGSGDKATAASSRGKERPKRGKYKPRVSRGWPAFFMGRGPTTASDGNVIITDGFEKAKSMLSDKWRKSFTLLKGSATETKRLTEESMHRELDSTGGNSDTELNDNQDSFVEEANQKLEQELKEGTWKEWIVNPPIMEYPYLQHAFPYDDYRTPENRVDNMQESPPQSVTIAWHCPQGSVLGEDFFSMIKFNYSMTMLQTIDVDTDDIRMDIYYHRGFELASRKMLDRVGIKLREGKEGDAREGVSEPSDQSIMPTEIQETENTAITDTASNSSSSLHVSSQSTGLSDTIASISDSTNKHMTLDNTSSTIGADQPADSTTLHSAQVDAVQEDSRPRDTTHSTSELSSDRDSNNPSTNSVSLNDYYQVNKFLSSLFLPHSGTQDPQALLSPGACRILQTMLTGLENKIYGMGCHRQREELTKRISQVDMEATSIKIANQRRKGRRLPGQTYPESTTTSDHASRESSVTIDTPTAETAGSTSNSSSMPPPPRPPRTSRNTLLPCYRKKKKIDMDDFVMRVPVPNSGSRGKNKQKEKEGTARAPKPFISNPLKISADMDPFSKARDYLENLKSTAK